MKMRGCVLLLFAGLMIASACGGEDDSGGSTSAEGLTSLSFRLDWIVDGSHTCFYVAQQNGYFRDEGLDVQILEGAGSGTAADLVANGSNDFGFSDAGVVAKAINDGASIKMVMGIYQRNPSVIISLSDSGIEGPEDLVGKSVGASAGEAPLQLLPAYLSSNDVDPDEVNVVNIDPAAKITALLQEQVDAIVGYSSSDLPIAETQAQGGVNVQHYADYGVVTLSNGIITSEEMISERPEVVRAFVRALRKGFEFCESNEQESVDTLVDAFPQTVNPEEASVALREVLGNLHTERTGDAEIGIMDPEDWSDSLDALEQYSGLTQPGDAEEYFTNEFLE
jgi:NitT/TauT family transport system substrate-binding protein